MEAPAHEGWVDVQCNLLSFFFLHFVMQGTVLRRGVAVTQETGFASREFDQSMSLVLSEAESRFLPR